MSVYIKSIPETYYVTVEIHQPIVLFKCCFASADVTVPFLKCVGGQWSKDITVNIHCDVTMCRWHCLGNHISQQWVCDVVATQGGTSVQLYHKALSTHLLVSVCEVVKVLGPEVEMFVDGDVIILSNV